MLISTPKGISTTSLIETGRPCIESLSGQLDWPLAQQMKCPHLPFRRPPTASKGQRKSSCHAAGDREGDVDRKAIDWPGEDPDRCRLPRSGRGTQRPSRSSAHLVAIERALRAVAIVTSAVYDAHGVPRSGSADPLKLDSPRRRSTCCGSHDRIGQPAVETTLARRRPSREALFRLGSRSGIPRRASGTRWRTRVQFAGVGLKGCLLPDLEPY